jgi:hypothetical protein
LLYFFLYFKIQTENFYCSVFELCDLWSDGTDVNDYAHLLRIFEAKHVEGVKAERQRLAALESASLESQNNLALEAARKAAVVARQAAMAAKSLALATTMKLKTVATVMKATLRMKKLKAADDNKSQKATMIATTRAVEMARQAAKRARQILKMVEKTLASFLRGLKKALDAAAEAALDAASTAEQAVKKMNALVLGSMLAHAANTAVVASKAATLMAGAAADVVCAAAYAAAARVALLAAFDAGRQAMDASRQAAETAERERLAILAAASARDAAEIASIAAAAAGAQASRLLGLVLQDTARVALDATTKAWEAVAVASAALNEAEEAIRGACAMAVQMAVHASVSAVGSVKKIEPYVASFAAVQAANKASLAAQIIGEKAIQCLTSAASAVAARVATEAAVVALESQQKALDCTEIFRQQAAEAANNAAQAALGAALAALECTEIFRRQAAEAASNAAQAALGAALAALECTAEFRQQAAEAASNATQAALGAALAALECTAEFRQQAAAASNAARVAMVAAIEAMIPTEQLDQVIASAAARMAVQMTMQATQNTMTVIEQLKVVEEEIAQLGTAAKEAAAVAAWIAAVAAWSANAEVLLTNVAQTLVSAQQQKTPLLLEGQWNAMFEVWVCNRLKLKPWKTSHGTCPSCSLRRMLVDWNCSQQKLDWPHHLVWLSECMCKPSQYIGTNLSEKGWGTKWTELSFAEWFALLRPFLKMDQQEEQQSSISGLLGEHGDTHPVARQNLAKRTWETPNERKTLSTVHFAEDDDATHRIVRQYYLVPVTKSGETLLKVKRLSVRLETIGHAFGGSCAAAPPPPFRLAVNADFAEVEKGKQIASDNEDLDAEEQDLLIVDVRLPAAQGVLVESYRDAAIAQNPPAGVVAAPSTLLEQILVERRKTRARDRELALQTVKQAPPLELEDSSAILTGGASATQALLGVLEKREKKTRKKRRRRIDHAAQQIPSKASLKLYTLPQLPHSAKGGGSSEKKRDTREAAVQNKDLAANYESLALGIITKVENTREAAVQNKDRAATYIDLASDIIARTAGGAAREKKAAARKSGIRTTLLYARQQAAKNESPLLSQTARPKHKVAGRPKGPLARALKPLAARSHGGSAALFVTELSAEWNLSPS